MTATGAGRHSGAAIASKARSVVDFQQSRAYRRTSNRPVGAVFDAHPLAHRLERP